MRNIKTRQGFEYWDRLNAIPRFSFLLAPSGSRIQKFEDVSGSWIEVYEAQKVMDSAQDEINDLRERLERLQPKAVES